MLTFIYFLITGAVSHPTPISCQMMNKSNMFLQSSLFFTQLHRTNHLGLLHLSFNIHELL